MGARLSKEELLCQEVQKGNHDAVKALRRDGTSLEWVDKEGRTPLILACTRGELLDMAITLLNLGANINAYRPGTHGGFPIHHAAKRGLEKTVTLLLSRGASPLAINDDGQTPIDMARSRGHVSVVRLLEEQLCLFSGMLRELSGPAILETLAPTWITRKIWAVVLPIESNPRKAPRFELAIYQSPKVNLWSGVRPSSPHPAGLCNVAQPRTVIQLAKAEVEAPTVSSREIVLHITDKTSNTKYKFLPENKGDTVQLEILYKACKGIPQVGVPSVIHQGLPSPAHQHNNPSQIHPMILHQSGPLSPASQTASASSSNISSPRKFELASPVVISEDVALAIALDASIRSATEEGILVSPTVQKSARMTDYNEWGDVSVRSYNSWGLPDPQKPPKEKSYDGWDEGEERSTYDGWGRVEAGPSRSKETSADTHSEIPTTQSSFLSRKEENAIAKVQATTANGSAPPTAPPLPSVTAVAVGHIRYPSIDASSVGMNWSSIQHDESVSKGDKKGEDKVSGMCVVCWDAPVEGACIPCGHLAGCMRCLSEVKGKNWGCPVCRATIEQVVKVYAV